MINFQRDPETVCIGQAAHSWVSGQLARHWGNSTFRRPEPFEEVCLGAAIHDIGMNGWDRRPELDPETGMPKHFLRMDQDAHLRCWSDAPDQALTLSPYAALCVSMHGQALFAGKADRPGVPAYLAEQERYQADLKRKLGVPDEQARRMQLLVWATDYLALAAITGWTPGTAPAPDEGIAVRELAPLHLGVTPWPFDADRLEIPYHGRVLTERSRTEPELHERLAAAPWTTVDVVWSPA